jgi:hypothetical protein
MTVTSRDVCSEPHIHHASSSIMHPPQGEKEEETKHIDHHLRLFGLATFAGVVLWYNLQTRCRLSPVGVCASNISTSIL